jgi:hypothetical protein
MTPQGIESATFRLVAQTSTNCDTACPLYFFQTLNFVVESFGFLNELFPFPSILDAAYPVFDLHLANVLFNVILPSVLESSPTKIYNMKN